MGNRREFDIAFVGLKPGIHEFNYEVDAGCWILDTGCWMLDTGYWMLDAGYWILDAGYLMLYAA